MKKLEGAGQIVYLKEGDLVHFTFVLRDGKVVTPYEAEQLARRILATASILTDDMVAQMNWENVTLQ